MLHDRYGLPVSGATPGALERFGRALDACATWRGDPASLLGQCTQEAPAFVMAHVLAAYVALGGREPGGARAARAICAGAAGLPATPRERLHLAAVEAVVTGEHDRAGALLDAILETHPRDLAALQFAHSHDYRLGDTRRLLRRVARVLPRWTPGMAGRDAVLAMYAFALEERGRYAAAEAAARQALDIAPRNLRAQHALLHVHEMRGEPERGLRAILPRAPSWGRASATGTHLWWHLALFHLALARTDEALGLYDARIAPHLALGVSVLIDASALLWRLRLRGVDLGARVSELAAHWAPHAADAHSVFSDIHAMMAFVADGREADAAILIATLRTRAAAPQPGAATARLVGLPVCRAIAAFGRRQWREVTAQLRALPALAGRLGGSRAQQSVLVLTLAAAEARGA
jgi:tetratricopeptide (TPR) repeat protein